MCGIAGVINLTAREPVSRETLDVMAATLTHRGPDDAGQHLAPDGRCGLAFRRLSIIDLATGNQPLANEDESVQVVFNGEIYNFRELRDELRARGHTFRTGSDGEVIVHLYEESGADCVGRLAGMFAVAIWDARRGRLLLARDRFGQKPLVYAQADGRLYFASEAKALLAVPGMPRQLDVQSLHRYLVFQYVPAPHSIFRGFRKLLPGHMLAVEAGQPLDGAPQRFWQLEPRLFPGSYEDAKEELGTLLREAVEKRLVADVPLGAFLSGGIDSSIVVGLMRELGVSPLRTFSIGFPDARYDETAYAREVAQRFETEHHEHIVTPAASEVLDTLAYYYDEPFADSSAIPTYYVSQWTRESVTVALTGDAGDECFLGYDRYRAAQLAARFDWLPAAVRQAIAAAAAWLPHHQPRTVANRLYRFAAALANEPALRYLAWVNVFTPTMLSAGYRPRLAERLDTDALLDWFRGLYHAGGSSAPECANHADLHSYLPYDLLTKVDIASMACGLECRCPFLDHELVEFATGLPLDWRLGRGGGKYILKDWARERLPASVLSRPKMGFGVPVGAWFRGELQDLLRERVLAPDGLARRVFREDWLLELVESHITGRSNHEHPLWSLLILESWLRRHQPIDLSEVPLT